MSPQKIVFPQVLEQLMNERYRRNRAALAEAAHLSPSSLSQYVRGRAVPSLEVLVHLADILDVSLDYLVFGQERTTPPPELGHLTAHLESHMRNIEEQNATLHDLTARIGAQAAMRLADLVRSTAEELLPDAASLGGTLSPSDVDRLERCAAATTIVTTDLSNEILILAPNATKDTAAPGMFGQLVAQNIAQGVRYEYIVPDGAKWQEEARLLRLEVAKFGELDDAYVEEHLQIRHVPTACVPGYVVQHISREGLERQIPDILERVSRFICPDPQDRDGGFLAYSEIVNPSSQHFDLIPPENTMRILREVRALRKKAGAHDGAHW
ncbi:MAG: helix-turn-helix domain-containing protein [Corynebacteriales bacterium]|nr:helix-turn-helix domain-containing protein [Mycobacteriales bacterium]